MEYQCLRVNAYSFGEYSIQTIKREDMLEIAKWRNEQMSVLRQQHYLTDDEQINYFNNVILPQIGMTQPKQLLFGYWQNDELIGYGGLTNTDWLSRRSEISFLLGTARTLDYENYAQDFSVFLGLLKRVAFAELGFNRLFTETFDIRPWHVKVLEENNFRFEGRLKHHVLIEGCYVDSLMHGCLKEYEHG